MGNWYEQPDRAFKVTKQIWDDEYEIDGQMECDCCQKPMGEIIDSTPEEYVEFWKTVLYRREVELCQECYSKATQEINENGEWV